MASERRMPERREPEAPPPAPPPRRARWPLVLAVMLVVGGVLGVTLYQFAGSKGSLWAGTLPGQDDETVDSAGGWRSTASMCNPGDWFCDGTLPTGSSSSMFTRHGVYFREDYENYNHSGIIGPMKNDMTAYAK